MFVKVSEDDEGSTQLDVIVKPTDNEDGCGNQPNEIGISDTFLFSFVSLRPIVASTSR
jgi:hypothetical protein